MISNFYIIDSSSLIELQRYNPIDVFPSVWQNVESLIHQRRLISPKEVFYEIADSDDALAKWCKRQRKCFVKPTQNQIDILKEILNAYPSFVKMDSKHDADPWVVALALETTRSAQQSLEPVRRIVITEEKPKGNRIRIPFVCQNFSVECLTILEMFRTEKWQF